MGFFDGLKKLTDRVTGGYGKIELGVKSTDVAPGDTLGYRINIEATGDLKAKAVLLRLRGTEIARMEIQVQDENGMSRTNTESHTNTTYEQVFQVEGELDMKAGETKTIKGEITIPQECEPTYHGVITNHEWVLEADVDIPWGKDLKQSKDMRIR